MFLVESIFSYIIKALLDPIKRWSLNNFASQNFPINDFLAGVGIFVIVGFTAIAMLLILQLRNYLVNRSLVITEKNANQKLDELIQEIEGITLKW